MSAEWLCVSQVEQAAATYYIIVNGKSHNTITPILPSKCFLVTKGNSFQGRMGVIVLCSVTYCSAGH
jgi:hypothetical protein